MQRSLSRSAVAALVIVIVAAALALPFMRQRLAASGPRPRRGYLAIAVFDPSRGAPQLVPNASVSVWAWAPTLNGTEFIPVFNGTGGVVYVNLSRLRGWAEAWVRRYGEGAVYSIEPSIIIWASYPVNLSNGSVEVLSQPFYEPLNLSLPLTGQGGLVEVEVSRPFRSVLRPSVDVSRSLKGVLGGPAQATTTTVTTTPTETSTYITNSSVTNFNGYSGPIGRVWAYFTPQVVAWYPNQSGVGPVSLAIAVAQPYSANSTALLRISANLLNENLLITTVNLDAVIASAASIATASSDVGLGEVAEAMHVLSPLIPGPSITLSTSSSQVYSYNVTGAVTQPGYRHYDVGQLYIMGQVALVNWTEWLPYGEAWAPYTWYLGTQLTAVQVVESGASAAPVLYNWTGWDPCVSISTWAYESELSYEAAEGNGGAAEELGSLELSCPLPNTPAPVDWQAYDYNLTQIMAVAPGGYPVTSYSSYEASNVPTTIGAVLDAGSAVTSAVGFLALASGVGEPAASFAFVISGMLDAVQISSSSIVSLVAHIQVYNFLPFTAFAYISNASPLYVEYGVQNYTLPRFMVFVNVSG
mgnify:CR=1 FL=1